LKNHEGIHGWDRCVGMPPETLSNCGADWSRPSPGPVWNAAPTEETVGPRKPKARGSGLARRRFRITLNSSKEESAARTNPPEEEYQWVLVDGSWLFYVWPLLAWLLRAKAGQSRPLPPEACESFVAICHFRAGRKRRGGKSEEDGRAGVLSMFQECRR